MNKNVQTPVYMQLFLGFFTADFIRTLIKYILIATALLCPRLLFAQNLVTNPNFTQSGLGWSTYCSMEVNPETVYGGSDASINVTEIDVERCFYQDICIMDGTYTLSLNASRRTDPSTPDTVGFVVTVTGLVTGTTYISQVTTRSNSTWALTPETYNFTIPAGTGELYLRLAFNNYLDASTLGILLGDIELRPQTDMSISGVSGTTAAILDSSYQYAVFNSAPGVSYNWSFDTGAAVSDATSATPTVAWSSSGTKTISVAIGNGACTVATINTSLVVAGALPLQLIDFTGHITDNKAVLSWTTANEQNSTYFAIQRSADGARYDSIGRVPCYNTPGTHAYSFSDPQFTTPGYYRLKQVDINGRSSFSPVITLKKAAADFTVAVYPSTVATTLQYSATVKKPAMALLEVLNAEGQTVMIQKTWLLQGANQQTLNVSQLARGPYFLKLGIPANGTAVIKQFNKL